MRCLGPVLGVTFICTNVAFLLSGNIGVGIWDGVLQLFLKSAVLYDVTNGIEVVPLRLAFSSSKGPFFFGTHGVFWYRNQS